MAELGGAAPSPRRRRVQRALAWSSALALGTALGLSWYVQRPSFRAALLASIEHALEGSVRGRIALSGLAHLGLSSARLERLEVSDERGVVVLALQDINLRYSVLELIGPWLPLANPAPRIEHVRVERSRVRLATDPESGQLTLVRALGRAPREPRTEAAAPLVVSLPAVELGEVLVTDDDPALATVALRVHRVHGRATIGGDQTEVTVQRFGMSLTAAGERWLSATGSLSFASAGPLIVSVHGFVRGTELDARLDLGAGALTASLDVPHALPATLRRAWPDWPLRAPVELHLSGHGPLDAVALAGQASVEQSRIDVDGSVAISDSPHAHLQLRGHALDVALVSERAPHTAIEAQASMDLSALDGGVRVDARLGTEEARLGTLRLPPVSLTLRSEAGATSAHAELGDARGQLALSAELAPGGATALEAHATRVSLPKLFGSGSGTLELSARARLVEGVARGSVSGRAEGLGTGALAIAAATLAGTFSGTLAAPEQTQLELSLGADAVAIGPARFERARLTTSGPWQRSRIEAEVEARGLRGTASGRLSLRDDARLEAMQLELSGGDVSLSAAASEWDIARDRLSIERLSLAGAAGELDGALQLGPGRVSLTARAERLDVARVSRALGVVAPVLGGVFTGSASLSTDRHDQHASVELNGEKVRVREISLGTVGVHGSLAGEHVELTLDGADAAFGQLAVRAAGQLDGAPFEPRSWRRATGAASLGLARLPLLPLGVALGERGPLRDVDGSVGVKLTLERTDPASFPDAFLEASTEGLSLALAPEAGGGHLDQPVLRASASLDGRTGQAQASVRAEDAHGPLASASGIIALDLPALARHPSGWARALSTARSEALVRLHPRGVSLLPPPLGARDLSGNVDATLLLRGSLSEPMLSLAAHGNDLLGSVSDSARAVDVSTLLEYASDTGRVQGTADVTQDGKGLVVARLEGRLPPLLELPARAAEVELRAAAMLNGAPLELWPAAARERIEARLYGSLELITQRDAPARQRAHLEIAGLSAHGQRLGNGRLTLERDGDALHADLLVGTREHFLRANLSGGAEGSAAGNVRGALQARDFDAASLSPLTSGLLSRVGGSINAQLAFNLRPSDRDWYLGIDGDARVENGSAHIQELGLEVRDIDARVRARSTPENTVLQIDPFSAKARSRTPNIRGNAELWLRGLRVQSGEADLSLSDVPLSLKGVSRGIARGEVKARLERQPEQLDLQVAIPTLRVRLPPSSTRALIALDDNPEFDVLQDTQPAERLDPEALRWLIRLDLGRNVRVQRGDLDVPLAGHPVIEFQHEVRPSGTIEAAPGGRITLFGQSFNIDRGLVQLDPDQPDNPRIDVTASWRAADGTTVYVDVTGRVDDASVSTRDDRGLQDVERFYLITGGSALADGARASDGSAAEAAALGQTVSLGINELLRNALGNVAVSIGTTHDDRASYSASVRLTDKLTFQGSFLPASDNSLEEATNDLTGTLDYRFSRRWSLRTELGTSGGAFDLLWSHRY